MFAAIGSTPYKVMLLLHILGIVVAFSPTFVLPFISSAMKKRGTPGVSVAALTEGNWRRVYGPAAVVAGFVGFGLAGMSKPTADAEPIYSMKQPWLMAAATLWIVIMAVMFVVLPSAERKVEGGDASGQKLIGASNGVLHLSLAAMLILMIWKPGL